VQVVFRRTLARQLGQAIGPAVDFRDRDFSFGRQWRGFGVIQMKLG
jgi:hypothetical protein